MKKFLQLVSVRHLVFGAVIFALVIGIALFDTSNDIKVTFSETEVNVSLEQYTMKIPYDIVESAELAQMPDPGEEIEGVESMDLRTGKWRNEAWGEYYVCTDLAAAKCIVVHLNDGRIFVFNSKNDKETTNLYDTFQGYLPEK